MGQMPFPFTAFPTLRAFIDAAVAQGCREGTIEGRLVGPRGPVSIRYLVAPGPNGALAILPEMGDEDRLSPEFESLRPCGVEFEFHQCGLSFDQLAEALVLSRPLRGSPLSRDGPFLHFSIIGSGHQCVGSGSLS